MIDIEEGLLLALFVAGLVCITFVSVSVWVLLPAALFWSNCHLLGWLIERAAEDCEAEDGYNRRRGDQI